MFFESSKKILFEFIFVLFEKKKHIYTGRYRVVLFKKILFRYQLREFIFILLNFNTCNLNVAILKLKKRYEHAKF